MKKVWIRVVKFLYRAIASVLVLFFINVIGGLIGFHLPINIMTVSVTSLLSGYGLLSLVLMKVLLF